MTNRTCKGCPDRHEACHDHCERYRAWKQEREAEQSYTYDMTHKMSCYRRTYEDKHRERYKKRFFGLNGGADR